MPAARLLTAFAIAAALAGCDAPPSVQKVIDEAEARDAEAAPKLDNPVLNVAQEEGREVYDRYILGEWAPKDRCENENLLWKFEADAFTRPGPLSDINRPCKLAVIEALTDGRYAIAGFCPQLTAADTPVVVPLTRINNDQIIIPGVGGGALYKCS